MNYRHAEAFCLMTYRSDDGLEEELLWNSRDGVTPFVITLKSGKQASHVDWQNDVCIPDYKPIPGQRVFVDLTNEKALKYAERNIAKWCTQERHNRCSHPSVTELAKEYMKDGAPDIVEII